MRVIHMRWSMVILFGASLLAGCATNGDPHDPLEPLNRGIYHFNDVVDKAVVKPVATGYKNAVPSPVRTGVGNFFSNLNDVIVFLNDLLQLNFQQGASDFSRVFWNSTIGVAGVFDVATSFDLPKHDEDFGQTLGYWGVGNGPYLVLPFLGPSTVRNAVGRVVDYRADLVYQQNDMAVRNSAVFLRVIQKRSLYLGARRTLMQAALDPYVFVREAYLQRRRNLVYNGNPPPLKNNANNHTDEDDSGAPAKTLH
ncbi:MAG TPA: ABC transporter [Betaproteobacteria bacterium]|nr:ABC transporter [Betaproteobacteria bacterium]